jgi:hypothetical protein
VILGRIHNITSYVSLPPPVPTPADPAPVDPTGVENLVIRFPGDIGNRISQLETGMYSLAQIECSRARRDVNHITDEALIGKIQQLEFAIQALSQDVSFL